MNDKNVDFLFLWRNLNNEAENWIDGNTAYQFIQEWLRDIESMWRNENICVRGAVLFPHLQTWITQLLKAWFRLFWLRWICLDDPPSSHEVSLFQDSANNSFIADFDNDFCRWIPLDGTNNLVSKHPRSDLFSSNKSELELFHPNHSPRCVMIYHNHACG